MKFALLFFLASCGFAEARLGETLADCEKRYGPVVQKIPALLTNSDKEAAVFSKEGITIVAETQNDVVWSITYTVSDLPEETATYLLEVNKPEGGWSSPVTVKGEKVFVSESRTQFAIFRPSSTKSKQKGSVQVCSRAFSKANRAAYDEKLLAIRDTLVERAKGGQLKGF
jgi:hypothetical protein